MKTTLYRKSDFNSTLADKRGGGKSVANLIRIDYSQDIIHHLHRDNSMKRKNL